MARRPTLEFLKTESGAGLVLTVAAAAALAMANSHWAPVYFAFVNHPIPVRVGDFAETRTVLGWVKDGLMAIFFLVVGMEIKFEVLRGELASPRRLALPILAAIGGMIAPALIYLAMNLGTAGAPQGWPAPTATDIAFALAVLADGRELGGEGVDALVGRREFRREVGVCGRWLSRGGGGAGGAPFERIEACGDGGKLRRRGTGWPVLQPVDTLFQRGQTVREGGILGAGRAAERAWVWRAPQVETGAGQHEHAQRIGGGHPGAALRRLGRADAQALGWRLFGDDRGVGVGAGCVVHYVLLGIQVRLGSSASNSS